MKIKDGISENASRRVFEVLATLADEIVLCKRDNRDAGHLERLMSCYSSLSKEQLPMFALSEQLINDSGNGELDRLIKCRAATTEGCACEQLKFVEIWSSGAVGTIYGLTPGSDSADEELSKDLTKDLLEYVLNMHLDKKHRVLIVFQNNDSLKRFTQRFESERKTLKAERMILVAKAADLQGILHIHAALKKDIHELIPLALRAKDLEKQAESLASHAIQLDRSIQASSRARQTVPGSIAWFCTLLGLLKPESNRTLLRKKELAHVQERLTRCRQQLEQVSMEIACLRPFLKESMTRLLERLSAHTYRFANAEDRLKEYWSDIKFIDEQLKSIPLSNNQNDWPLAGQFVATTWLKMIETPLGRKQFDVILLDQPERMPLAFIYWAAAQARVSIGFNLNRQEDTPQAVSCSSESASYWLKQSVVELLVPNRVCGVSNDWSPTSNFAKSASIAAPANTV